MDLLERGGKFLDKLIRQYEGKTILLVSHGGLIRMMIAHLLKMTAEEALALKPANTSVSIIEIGEDEIKAHIINCVKHLGEEPMRSRL